MNLTSKFDCSGDDLSASGIHVLLENADVFKIEIRDSVTSTNSLLREMAAAVPTGAMSTGAFSARGFSTGVISTDPVSVKTFDIPEGYVLVAKEQTAGKGRMGRSFYSPGGHGAYFSLLLRPGCGSDDAVLITAAAAVAAAEAIEDVTGVRAGIKWVNDLLVGEKKVCGILTEAVFNMESSLIESAVLGIGINITRPDDGFPDGLENIAAPLIERRSKGADLRGRLIAATLDHFWGYYAEPRAENPDLPPRRLELTKRRFLDEYRSRSVILGRYVDVHSCDGKKRAKAVDIDDNCALIVRFDNGGFLTLNSGEVSIAIDK